jgi:hypothetical protein
MSLNRFFIVCLTAFTIAAMQCATAEEQLGPGTPPPVPLDQRGLAVGEHIPPIDAVDQFGRRQTLRTLSGPNGLVLLFVRSADW